jgi:hypothetical protein
MSSFGEVDLLMSHLTVRARISNRKDGFQTCTSQSFAIKPPQWFPPIDASFMFMASGDQQCTQSCTSLQIYLIAMILGTVQTGWPVGCTAYLLIRSSAVLFGGSIESNNAYQVSGRYILAALLLSASVLSSRLTVLFKLAGTTGTRRQRYIPTHTEFNPNIVSTHSGFVGGQRNAKCCTCCF